MGENFYNRGVFNSVIIVEAIKKAQEISGKKVINGEDMRAGLEALDLTAAHLESIGLGGFTNPMKISCNDHAGAHDIFIQKWNGKDWTRVSGSISPLSNAVRPLLAEAADKYIAEQTDWQTQKCG